MTARSMEPRHRIQANPDTAHCINWPSGDTNVGEGLIIDASITRRPNPEGDIRKPEVKQRIGGQQ
jgi:hypothetical protein